MIDFYFWTTPNGYKVLVFLEETGIPYRILPVNISRGEQFDPGFLRISPNNKMPAIVDNTPRESGVPISLFESGAILLYLAEKSGYFLPTDKPGRVEVLQWLYWQMGGLGPMLGQNLHFGQYAPEKIPYSIADMASYPWVFTLRSTTYSILGGTCFRRSIIETFRRFFYETESGRLRELT
jgi:GST-like protein